MMSADPHMEMRSKAEEGEQENGRGAEDEPAGVGADIAGLNATQDGTDTLGAPGQNVPTPTDDAAIDAAPEDVARDDQEWLADQKTADLVDPVLVRYKAVERS